VLLAGALFLRLEGIREPSVDQRETESALLARQWSLGDGAGLPVWKQRVLRDLRQQVKPIEPPILDYLTATEFRLAGSENFWFPRLVSALLWVFVGGTFLYLIALRVTSRAGALVALPLFLTWPYAALHSRLFMPDAMMVSGLLAAALMVIRYWEAPSRQRFVVAGLVSALATAVKPGVAFCFLIALFGSLALARRQLRDALLGGRLLLFGVMTAAAAGAYYVYGTYLSEFISRGASTRRITPDLLSTTGFWKGWWQMVSYLVRYPQPQQLLALVPLALGLAGMILAPRGTPRGILVGLSAGYIAFGLAFANYTSTHPYYALPLIPILALAIGLLAGQVLERLPGSSPLARSAFVLLIALVIGGASYKTRAVLAGGHTQQAIADYRRIGQLTGHTSRAIVVDDHLGTPAMYWGWIVAKNWELDYNERLPPWIDRAKEDFLVVVGVSQLETARGLHDFVRGLPVVARTRRYAIFDLRPRTA
jgi:4-amino-4-deoxy-L-arabinose transferase-like glycosyltransferase